MVVVSRCEALSPYDWWHEEDHVVNLTVADGAIRLRDDWTVPVAPLIGCLATAPARETVFSKYEGDHGGNLDVREITAGATVVLPVETRGAGLYFGDCKAAIGDGEIVCAPECGTRIVATARPFDRPSAMGSPRIVTADYLMTVVSAPSVTDAARSAFRQLKLWLEQEWELTNDEAAMVMGMGAHCGIGQVTQPAAYGQVLDRSIAAAARQSRSARSLVGSRPMSADDAPAVAANSRPWHGVLVANPVILDSNLDVDFDRYAEHVAWLAECGCDGITPNGSLGEYQSLSREERERTVTAAIEVAPDGFTVIPGGERLRRRRGGQLDGACS